ncbi:hypothetical protein QYE76_038834 [Lolium multiflorum]|uniref:Ribosome biogenesis protein NSA2 homolog n=1 Tax=Lolium multiflorum TaxID=4521 RepID=A0AAD8WT87_LOLMU|nr:hypothetical protein QYE76_038834 [Lolium multiflorum]
MRADVRALLRDEAVYEAAAAEAYPKYNKAHLVSLDLPDRSGDIIITTYGELDRNDYLDPRTAQVATVDHVKQTCTKLRPAADEELPSAYIEEFRNAIDIEVSKYVGDAYPKGVCAVYCTSGKDIEEPGADFGLAVVISAARRSPQNFCNGSWRSVWTLEFSYAFQLVEIKGKIQVGAHYFEEGNVQLDTDVDRKDSTLMQTPEDTALSVTNIIRHQESEYFSSLEESYLNLSDATFKPQGDYIELHQKRHGRRLDYEERKRKREARSVKKNSKDARNLLGAKGKRFAKKRYAEKAQMKKTLKMHDESTSRQKVDDDVQEGAIPPYLLDRDQTQRAKVLSNTIKQKRKEKAGKWDVPLPKVRPVAEEEMFKVLRTGKRKTKQWKRMVTKATFVGPGFTRKPPKYERFIRPTGLRFTKAHVTHPELKCTFNLDIISVKKNPNGPMYTSLGVMTRGTIIEVNVSELGLVTPAGKVVWGKYAQVTNNPENDGCINAVLLV